MKKLIFLLVTFWTATFSAYASDCYYSSDCWSSCLGFDSVLTFDVGGGYRQDNLQWKTFPEFSPLSEVKEKWKDLSIGVVEANTQFLACEHYLLKVDFDYGWFNRNGKQHFKMFDLITNTQLQDFTSRTRGRVYNLSGGIGYQFNWCCYRYAFAPLVGYSYNYQKFTNRKYHDEAVDLDLATHNNYQYRWRGPWIGFATAFQISCDWQVYFDYAYHWVRYRGKVHENFLLGEFAQHHKSNKVHGNEFTVGTTYDFGCDWLFGLKFNYKNYSSNKGHIAIDGTRAPLRGLRWNSWTITADVGYMF